MRRLVMGPAGSRFKSMPELTRCGAREQRQLICIEFEAGCQSRWLIAIACQAAIGRASVPRG